MRTRKKQLMLMMACGSIALVAEPSARSAGVTPSTEASAAWSGDALIGWLSLKWASQITLAVFDFHGALLKWHVVE